MKYIYLEYRSNSPVIVSDEMYEAILALLETERLCHKCHRKFTDSNPMVLLNLCLSCFFKKDEHQNLTFLEKTREVAGESYYTFLDTDGIVHSTSTKSEQVTRDIYATLRYWDFPVPETYTRGGNEWMLYPFYWKVYGDVRAQAVVIEYCEQYSASPTVAFLVDKLGIVMELNKRKKHIQKLLRDAREQLESYKKPSGLYVFPNGHERYWIGQADEYEFLAAQAAARLETEKVACS